MLVEYKPFLERKPDRQYRELLIRIKNEGVKVRPQQEEEAIMILRSAISFRYLRSLRWPLPSSAPF